MRAPAERAAARGLDLILVPAMAPEIRQPAYDDTLRRARETVDRLSGGRIGYIHIAAMDQASLDVYERDLYAQAHGKERPDHRRAQQRRRHRRPTGCWPRSW
jgi:hypothetical protein